MKKIGCFICLIVGILILPGCVRYSGYINSTVTPVYYAPHGPDMNPNPPMPKPSNEERREALRHALFEIPNDHSTEW
jgi:hypothetical protein